MKASEIIFISLAIFPLAASAMPPMGFFESLECMTDDGSKKIEIEIETYSEYGEDGCHVGSTVSFEGFGDLNKLGMEFIAVETDYVPGNRYFVSLFRNANQVGTMFPQIYVSTDPSLNNKWVGNFRKDADDMTPISCSLPMKIN